MWPYHDRQIRELLRAEGLVVPATVPWAMLEPHERQARRNHDQSLEELARRGGLDPSEAVAVLEDRRWAYMTWPASVRRLLELVAEWLRAHPEDRMEPAPAFPPWPARRWRGGQQ